jgi:hypothetical protein
VNEVQGSGFRVQGFSVRRFWAEGSKVKAEGLKAKG